jgi:tRNA nucleotidyltransferase (CCA-adding enzyme)
MIEVLRDCGALARLLPEVAARFGDARTARRSKRGAGAHLAAALDLAAKRGASLPVRYAILAHDLGSLESPPAPRANVSRSVRLAEQVSSRLKVPAECRDAARLAARWRRSVDEAGDLPAARLLDLLNATDALRRPERVEALLEVCACVALSARGAGSDYAPAQIVRAALAVVKRVDAGAIARGVPQDRVAGGAEADDAIARAIRFARLRALRDWRQRTRSRP